VYIDTLFCDMHHIVAQVKMSIDKYFFGKRKGIT